MGRPNQISVKSPRLRPRSSAIPNSCLNFCEALYCVAELETRYIYCEVRENLSRCFNWL